MKSQLKKWIFLSGDRYYIASGILVLMMGVVLIPNFTRFAIRNTTPLTYMASALITGNITLITVVVAINQLILSQELESPGSIRDEIEQTAEYQQTALNQQVTQTNPSNFLQQLLQQTRQHAQSLQEFLPESSDEVSDQLLTKLPDQCKESSDQLESAPDTLSNVIVPILGVNYSDYIQNCHQLQAQYDEKNHGELHTILDQLTSDLQNLDVARQYVTTAFMKEELATLSRSLLYIGMFSIPTAVALLFQLTTYPEPVPPMPILFTIAALTALFGLIPIALLIAFILRVATVAHYLASITPFQT